MEKKNPIKVKIELSGKGFLYEQELKIRYGKKSYKKFGKWAKVYQPAVYTRDVVSDNKHESQALSMLPGS